MLFFKVFLLKFLSFFGRNITTTRQNDPLKSVTPSQICTPFTFLMGSWLFWVRHSNIFKQDYKCMMQNIVRNKKYPANIYFLKFNNRNTRKRCKVCSELTMKIPERCQWRRSGDFIVNFEHILDLFLLFLLTLNK